MREVDFHLLVHSTNGLSLGLVQASEASSGSPTGTGAPQHLSHLWLLFPGWDLN